MILDTPVLTLVIVKVAPAPPDPILVGSIVRTSDALYPVPAAVNVTSVITPETTVRSAVAPNP